MMSEPVERNTKQKRAIRDVFGRESRPMSPVEVFEAAERDSRGLGRATVYRTIKALVEDGWLIALDVPGKGTLFEVSGKGHHHHFLCVSCARVYELDGCESKLSFRLPRGFRAIEHEVTVRGLCAHCRDDGSAKSRG